MAITVCPTCGENPLDDDGECLELDVRDDHRLLFCDWWCLGQYVDTRIADTEELS